MNIITRFTLAILISSVAMLGIAAEPEPQLPTTPPPANNVPSEPTLGLNEASNLPNPLDARSPMMNDINSALAASKAAIADLMASSAGTTDHDANILIQKEIATLKQQAELDILGIQARYARSEGSEELAQKIEAAIANIISPPAPIAPAEPRTNPGSQK